MAEIKKIIRVAKQDGVDTIYFELPLDELMTEDVVETSDSKGWRIKAKLIEIEVKTNEKL